MKVSHLVMFVVLSTSLAACGEATEPKCSSSDSPVVIDAEANLASRYLGSLFIEQEDRNGAVIYRELFDDFSVEPTEDIRGRVMLRNLGPQTCSPYIFPEDYTIPSQSCAMLGSDGEWITEFSGRWMVVGDELQVELVQEDRKRTGPNPVGPDEPPVVTSTLLFTGMPDVADSDD